MSSNYKNSIVPQNSLKDLNKLDNFLGEERAISTISGISSTSVESAFSTLINDINTRFNTAYLNDLMITQDLSTLHSGLSGLITEISEFFGCLGTCLSGFSAPTLGGLTSVP